MGDVATLVGAVVVAALGGGGLAAWLTRGGTSNKLNAEAIKAVAEAKAAEVLAAAAAVKAEAEAEAAKVNATGGQWQGITDGLRKDVVGLRGEVANLASRHEACVVSLAGAEMRAERAEQRAVDAETRATAAQTDAAAGRQEIVRLQDRLDKVENGTGEAAIAAEVERQVKRAADDLARQFGIAK